MEKPDLVVTKISRLYRICSFCEGKGEKYTDYRGKRFISTCAKCSGSGRVCYTQREEIPFTEALELIK